MEIARNIVVAVYFIVCAILVVLVLKQTKEDNGASEAIMGGSSSNFYEKNKGRTTEGKIKRATIVLTIIFFILTIVLDVLYVM